MSYAPHVALGHVRRQLGEVLADNYNIPWNISQWKWLPRNNKVVYRDGVSRIYRSASTQYWMRNTTARSDDSGFNERDVRIVT